MNGKGSKPRNCFSKQYKENFDQIEWRDIGTYCFECGLTLKNPKNIDEHGFVCKDGSIFWVCNPNGKCNFN